MSLLLLFGNTGSPPTFVAGWAIRTIELHGMKKNVASQKVGAQMVSASDGSAFAGPVTVSVTIDAGVQATGSVGSGACAHEGNGYHTYAPAQAETNGDLVAFTFTGTGAIPQTVQMYTTFPQTGDAYAETVSGTYGLSIIENLVDGLETTIGAAGAGLSAIPWNASWDAEVQSEVNDGLVAYNAASTTNITAGTLTTVTNLTNLPAITAGWLTATGIAADAITASKIAADVTTELQSGLATVATLATVEGKIDTVDTVVDAIKVQTDKLSFTVTNQVDANIQYVNDIAVDGDGQPGTEWGPV